MVYAEALQRSFYFSSNMVGAVVNRLFGITLDPNFCGKHNITTGFF